MSSASYLQSCRACKHEFRAAARYLGKIVACPTCRQPVAISDEKPVADKLVGKTIGGCTLQRRLGAGALGVVYEAVRTDGARMAVKLLSSEAAKLPDVVARFEREARLAMEINHPGVVAVHGCGQERGAHFLVMDFVDGATLAAMVEDQPLPWREAFAMVLPVAEALAVIHAQGVIHRDIKPANILVGADGKPKLADLGLAKNLDDEGTGLTMQNVALGSPAYMPPEQIRDARSVGPSADLYALGATLFECLTGKLPFSGRTGPEVMTRVLKDPVPDPRTLVPDLPAGVAALVMATLAKTPAGRPADAGALAADLRAVLADPDTVPPSARPPAPTAPGPARTGVPAWTWIAVAAAVAAAVAYAVIRFL
ncbi:MAG: hypothetical protein RLZZ127_430 [Planctomycetota bacterium]